MPLPFPLFCSVFVVILLFGSLIIGGEIEPPNDGNSAFGGKSIISVGICGY